MILYQSGLYREAKSEFSNAISYSSYNETYRQAYADASAMEIAKDADGLLGKGAVVAAIQQYRQALRRLPSGDAASSIMARLEQAKGQFQHVPSIMVGGTGWTEDVYSHGHTPGETAEQRARIDAAFRDKLKRAGLPQSTFMALDEYDQTIGVAVSASFIKDLGMRVFLDQFARGQATPELQTGYDRLKNQEADLLVCHSNGAMVCLAALRNGDTRARRVRILGPQISRDAMAEWQALLDPPPGSAGNRIDSLEVVLMTNDPVPMMSAVGGMLTELVPDKALPRLLRWGLGKEDLSGPEVVTPPFQMRSWQGLRDEERFRVVRLDCPDDMATRDWLLACHEFTTYAAGLKVRERYRQGDEE